MNKLLLDQTIIVKALYILTAMDIEPDDFITKEMLERLPDLREKEMLKLTILEEKIDEK